MVTAPECVCTPPPHYDGPQPDCPAHGIDAEALRWLHGIGLCPVGNHEDLGRWLAVRSMPTEFKPAAVQPGPLRWTAADVPYAIIHVRSDVGDIPGEAWPIVERVPGGWQSGAHHYPDADVLDVTPLWGSGVGHHLSCVYGLGALVDFIEIGHGIIANAGGWHDTDRGSSPGWREAARRWCDRYFELLAAWQPDAPKAVWDRSESKPPLAPGAPLDPPRQPGVRTLGDTLSEKDNAVAFGRIAVGDASGSGGGVE